MLLGELSMHLHLLLKEDCQSLGLLSLLPSAMQLEGAHMIIKMQGKVMCTLPQV